MRIICHLDRGAFEAPSGEIPIGQARACREEIPPLEPGRLSVGMTGFSSEGLPGGDSSTRPLSHHGEASRQSQNALAQDDR
jgi:hypothetical protein